MTEGTQSPSERAGLGQRLPGSAGSCQRERRWTKGRLRTWLAGPRPPLLQQPQKYVNEKLGLLFMRLQDSFFIWGMRTNENMKYFSDDTVSTQKAHSLEAMCMCTGATWDQTWTLVQAQLRKWVEAMGPSPPSARAVRVLLNLKALLEGTELRGGGRAWSKGRGGRLHLWVLLLYNWSKDSALSCTRKRDVLLPTSTKCSLLFQAVPEIPKDVQVSLFIALTVKIHHQLAPPGHCFHAPHEPHGENPHY